VGAGFSFLTSHNLLKNLPLTTAKLPPKRAERDGNEILSS
jgi:hypothetical protein